MSKSKYVLIWKLKIKFYVIALKKLFVTICRWMFKWITFSLPTTISLRKLAVLSPFQECKKHLTRLCCLSWNIILKLVLDVKKRCYDLLFSPSMLRDTNGIFWCLMLIVVVSLCYSNVGEALVGKGLATVVRYRMEDDQRSEHYDELLAAEARAQKKGVGLHSKKEAPIHRVADVSGVRGYIWKKYVRKQQEILEQKWR